MFSVSLRLILLLVLGGLACGESTAPRVDPAACASTTSDPTFACARLDARLMYNGGRSTGVGPYVFFGHVSDTARYRLVIDGPDSTGHTMIEVRRRRSESLDTATVALLAKGPPQSNPFAAGPFLCSAVLARLHFSAVGAVPDTLRIDWTLSSLAYTSDQCAVNSPSSEPVEP